MLHAQYRAQHNQSLREQLDAPIPAYLPSGTLFQAFSCFD